MPSEKVLERKKQVVQELSESIKSAKSIVFADYRGLTVEQDTELRSALRKAGVEYKVVKNTLTKLAANENGLNDLEPHFNGPTSMAFSDQDVIAPAKVMVEYAKKYEKLELKAGVIEGNIFDVKGIEAIASLPSKEELLAKAMGSLMSPITGLVNVLNGNIRGLVIALNAIAEQKAANA
ncbi:MAG: 50S ribosomal protein L10 [Bacteroidales bacterium]|nr:50S ribosomal protein L10 [Bacteroidales bacterium]